MKDSVRTCALSKKWRYLWTSYPNLALFERNFSGRKQFTNFRNVERCFVHLSEILGNFVLPYCLFSCATLTSLISSIPWALKLPSQIWLPNLKHLHLQCSTFVDKHSTEQQLSSCPVLEESTIRYCTWDNLETLTIRAPMLKILTIQDEDFDCSSVCPSVHPYTYRL
ncbi:hypothetical protein EUGRSUZ_E04105 [Eucalyptus grandis]|uniref:Uncharacterized protein n=2 Tax=Eucalyptus grandis TaxID=71139 RepID=A0ACC3L2C9_EUCGR|nr:hypothetical protein EUGRSUZ_E04105 [Eucalyptus grandis]